MLETPAVAAEPELIESGGPAAPPARAIAAKPTSAAAVPIKLPRNRRPLLPTARPLQHPAEAPAATGDATPAPDGERKRTAVRAIAATAIARAVRTAINRVRRSAPTARSGRTSSVPAAIVLIVRRAAIVRTGRAATAIATATTTGQAGSGHRTMIGAARRPIRIRRSPSLLALKEQLEAEQRSALATGSPAHR